QLQRATRLGRRGDAPLAARGRRTLHGYHPRPMTALAPQIFKAYDIRGLAGTELDPEAAEQIGRAFAQVIGELEGKPTSELRLGLGRDMRLSAPEMAAAYRSGMCAEGATVLDAGQVGTEMLYY